MTLSYMINPADPAPLFERAEAEICGVSQPAVELIFSEVEHLSFVLLARVVHLFDQVRKAGGTCALINPTNAVRRSLQTAGIHRLVRFQVGFS